MGENLMRMYHRKQIVGGAQEGRERESALQRGLAEIIRDSEVKGRRKDKDAESVEMKLLAEQLSRRLETKFERNHEIEMERERNETERRLRQIGDSYEREIRAKEKQLERERALMLERLEEKEKKMMREIELKLADRESRLELERRRLESRLDDLINGKEELDRARKELMTTVDNEMERLRLEKESVVEREKRLMREEKMGSVVEGIEEERQRNHGRIAHLEATVSQLRERLHRSEEERKDAISTIVNFEATKAELSVAKNNYLRQLEESRRLGERLRERDDYEEMKMENEKLKIEMRSCRRASRSEEMRERERKETMEKMEIEAAKNKERELKMIISMMSEKMREITTERDYLRKECRELRRERMEERRREKKEKTREKEANTRHFSSLSDGEDESVITSLSSFDEDITNIKKRINKIDTMSHALEETLRAVCILPPPERMERERDGGRSGQYEEVASPIQYSGREGEGERRWRESPSLPIHRRLSEEEVMERRHVHVEDSSTRVSPPVEIKRDSMKVGIEDELTRNEDNENKDNLNRKEELGDKMNMEGIDPLMAHYMKLVMEGRKKEKDEENEVPLRSEFGQKEEEEEIEILKFDPVETGGDEDGFEW